MGSMHPKVLIPLAYSTEEKSPLARRNFVRSSYVFALGQQGLIPSFAPVVLDKILISEMLDTAQGILFMGGWDVDPKQYGEPVHPKTIVAPNPVDEIELWLCREAVERRLPLLGICRGAQVLNVALGGTLHQHVPDLYPSESHLGAETYDENVNHLQKDHRVNVEAGSRFAKIIKCSSLQTNSAHHQCLAKISKDLRVAAKTPAGVVEVVEHIDSQYFCLGVQWHPELLADENSSSIFTAFANACKAQLDK